MPRDVIIFIAVTIAILILIGREILIDRRVKGRRCPRCGIPLPEDGGVDVEVPDAPGRTRILSMCSACAEKSSMGRQFLLALKR